MSQAQKKTSNRHLIDGKNAEHNAMLHLQANGLKVIDQNYSIRRGEIDIIAMDSNTLVFVEVRYRKNNMYGSPLESVTPSKQRKIRLAAEHYLQIHPAYSRSQARFDVVGICGQEIQWIKNAF